MASTFAELGVPPRLVASLTDRGIAAPFPIQSATIPDALEGRDLCGRAPTGSGKTIAFGIPLVLGVGRADPRKPRGLVLVPTRELAAQVSRELELLAKPKGPWVAAFYGGVGMDRQIAALRRGVDIAVATPGRLADLIGQRWVDLSEVELVVIDEADRMADMGFLPEVRRLLDQCPTDRQTLLFSATLDGDVDVLIRSYQRDPVRHEHTDPDEGGARAEHRFWSVERGSRLDVTARIVERMGPTVVFTRTKHGADRVARQLHNLGVSAVAIHGNRSQAQRERALDTFLRGGATALVATDVAARGIHVDGVACVIHFDPPADHKDYVHRSGRTARAGAEGLVVSLVPRELQSKVAKLQDELGYPGGFERADVESLPRPARPPKPAGAPAAPAPERPRAGGGPKRASRTATTTPSRPATPAGPRGAGKPGNRPDKPGDRASKPGSRPGKPGSRPSTPGSRPGKPGKPGKPGTRSGGPTTGRTGSRSSAPRRGGGSTGRDTRAGETDRSGRAPRAGGPARRKATADPRPPLADGQRRPSGAARRKAKRDAARAAELDD